MVLEGGIFMIIKDMLEKNRLAKITSLGFSFK
jgi:hypothetical protein